MKEYNKGRSWDEFDKFEEIVDKYMPSRGEGNTMASQIVTAVNKLVYKWYNDGDVFDNTYSLEGWCNDLSSYANWLYHHANYANEILIKIKDCIQYCDYENLLYELAEKLLDAKYLEFYENMETKGSIYQEDGPFEFAESDYEDEDWDEDEDW